MGRKKTSTTMELTDLAELANPNAYKGITKFNGIGSKRKLLWKTFTQQMKSYLTTATSREKSIIYGKEIVLTDENINAEAKITFDDMVVEDAAGANKLFKEDYFYTANYQQVLIDACKKRVLELYLKVFTGNCKSEVEINGWENVHLNYPKFDKDFGAVTATEIADAERIYELGIVKKNGTEMLLDDNVVDMLNRWIKSQHDLRLIVPKDQHDVNPFLKPASLVKVICRKMHPHYQESINGLRYRLWLCHTQDKSPAERQAQMLLGTAAWKEYPIPLNILTEHLIEKFERNRVLWDTAEHSSDGGRKARMLAYGVEGQLDNNNFRRKALECWDCGLEGHRRGEDVCRAKGAMKGKNCPGWLKNKIGKQPQYRQNAGNRNKRKRIDNGDGSSSKDCFSWAKGHCKHGANCKFSHSKQKGRDSGNQDRSRPKRPKSGGAFKFTNDKRNTVIDNITTLALEVRDGTKTVKENMAAQEMRVLVAKSLSATNARIFQIKAADVEAYEFTPKDCDHGGFDMLSRCSSCDGSRDEQTATSTYQQCVPIESISALQKPLEVIGVDTDEVGPVLSNVYRGPLDNGCTLERHVNSQVAPRGPLHLTWTSRLSTTPVKSSDCTEHEDAQFDNIYQTECKSMSFDAYLRLKREVELTTQLTREMRDPKALSLRKRAYFDYVNDHALWNENGGTYYTSIADDMPKTLDDHFDLDAFYRKYNSIDEIAFRDAAEEVDQYDEDEVANGVTKSRQTDMYDTYSRDDFVGALLNLDDELMYKRAEAELKACGFEIPNASGLSEVDLLALQLSNSSLEGSTHHTMEAFMSDPGQDVIVIPSGPASPTGYTCSTSSSESSSIDSDPASATAYFCSTSSSESSSSESDAESDSESNAESAASSKMWTTDTSSNEPAAVPDKDLQSPCPEAWARANEALQECRKAQLTARPYEEPSTTADSSRQADPTDEQLNEIQTALDEPLPTNLDEIFQISDEMYDKRNEDVVHIPLDDLDDFLLSEMPWLVQDERKLHTIDSEGDDVFDQWGYSTQMCESPPDDDELLRRVLDDSERTNIGPSPEAVMTMIGIGAEDYSELDSNPVTTRSGTKAQKKALECKIYVMNHNNLGKAPRRKHPGKKPQLLSRRNRPDDSSSFSSIKAAVINEAVAKGEVKRVGAMGKRTGIKKVLNSSHKKYKLRNDPARQKRRREEAARLSMRATYARQKEARSNRKDNIQHVRQNPTSACAASCCTNVNCSANPVPTVITNQIKRIVQDELRPIHNIVSTIRMNTNHSDYLNTQAQRRNYNNYEGPSRNGPSQYMQNQLYPPHPKQPQRLSSKQRWWAKEKAKNSKGKNRKTRQKPRRENREKKEVHRYFPLQTAAPRSKQKTMEIMAQGSRVMDLDTIAVDNCARTTASTELTDFLSIDRSPNACNSIRLIGVGGTAACGGRGIMCFCVHHDEHGTWLLIDPDGVYIEKDQGEDTIRIVSANKMEACGLYIEKKARKSGSVNTKLACTRNNVQMNLYQKDGLTVLPTVRRSLKNFKNNRTLVKVVQAIKEGRHSPLVNMSQLEQSYAASINANTIMNSTCLVLTRGGNGKEVPAVKRTINKDESEEEEEESEEEEEEEEEESEEEIEPKEDTESDGEATTAPMSDHEESETELKFVGSPSPVLKGLRPMSPKFGRSSPSRVVSSGSQSGGNITTPNSDTSSRSNGSDVRERRRKRISSQAASRSVNRERARTGRKALNNSFRKAGSNQTSSDEEHEILCEDIREGASSEQQAESAIYKITTARKRRKSKARAIQLGFGAGAFGSTSKDGSSSSSKSESYTQESSSGAGSGSGAGSSGSMSSSSRPEADNGIIRHNPKRMGPRNTYHCCNKGRILSYGQHMCPGTDTQFWLAPDMKLYCLHCLPIKWQRYSNCVSVKDWERSQNGQPNSWESQPVPSQRRQLNEEPDEMDTSDDVLTQSRKKKKAKKSKGKNKAQTGNTAEPINEETWHRKGWTADKHNCDQHCDDHKLMTLMAGRGCGCCRAKARFKNPCPICWKALYNDEDIPSELLDFSYAGGISLRCKGWDGNNNASLSLMTPSAQGNAADVATMFSIWSENQYKNEFEEAYKSTSRAYANHEGQMFQSCILFKASIDKSSQYSRRLLRDITKAGRNASMYVLNAARLSKEERAMLWHNRLAHVSPEVPIELSKKDINGVPTAYGVEVSHRLNCDCVVCDKAKFKIAPIVRVAKELRSRAPPFSVIYVDGFGGQHSMGKKGTGETYDTFGKSIGNAVGGYVFVCSATGAVTPMLYSRKSQFPQLLRRFILGVLTMHWKVQIIRATDSEIVSNDEVEQICAEFDILVQPTSVGTPEELGFAENAVGMMSRMARAMAINAPHLPSSLWSAMFMYAGVLSWILPKKANDNLTAYECIWGRPPNLRELFIGVFGCPAEMRRLPTGAKYKSKLDERTQSFYFIGTDHPCVLLYCPARHKIYRASKRKVRLHEGAYTKTDPLSLLQLKERLIFDKGNYDNSGETIQTVPTVRTLCPTDQQLLNEGETPQDLSVHLELGESIQKAASVDLEEMLSKQLRAALSEPTLQDQLIRLAKKLKPSFIDTNGLSQPVGKMNTRSGMINSNEELIVPASNLDANESADLRAKKKASSINAKATQRTNSVIEAHKKHLPPLHKAPAGSRVKIKSTSFDKKGDKLKWSADKPPMIYGTVRGRDKGGIVKVLWDADSEPMESHWKHLSFASADEDPSEPLASLMFLELNNAVKFQDTARYFTVVANYSGLPRTAQPYRDIERAEDAMVSSTMRTAEYWNTEAIQKKERFVPYTKNNKKTQKTSAVKKAARPKEWPRTFAECLLKPEWREWLDAVRKEHSGWEENRAAVEVPRSTRNPEDALVRIGELFTVKRDNRKKFRPYVMGNFLRPNHDFFSTFSGTVASDSIRFGFSLACALGVTVYQADASCAYLQADDHQEPIYCYKPSYWDFVNMTIEQLQEVRKTLLEIQAQGGIAAVKRYVTDNYNSVNILKVLKPIYGIPSAGAEWATKLQRILTEDLKFKRCHVDGSVYYRTDGPLVHEPGPWKGKTSRATVAKQTARSDEDRTSRLCPATGTAPHRRATVWVGKYLVLMSYVDDFPYFGTTEMRRWFETEVVKKMKLVLNGECTDFVSIEVKQDLIAGTIEATFSKYYLVLGEKYKEQLGTRKCRVPMKHGVDKILHDLVVAPEAHQAVADFPYRQLIGSLSFPSCHAKLEIRHAISLLSRHLCDWDATCISAALDLLAYCVYSHDVGLIWSRGTDPHGHNVPYAFSDSGFQAPRSQGCRIVKMNNAAISLTSQRHTTVDTSTTAAELSEVFLASNDIAGFRNMMTEMGMWLDGPTTIYCDCQPAIQVAEGERNMASTSRTLPIRTWKIRERLDMQECALTFCRTYDQQADQGTKALDESQFVYLRDCMNGYNAVLLEDPTRKMPHACYSYKQLTDHLGKFANMDAERANKSKRKLP